MSDFTREELIILNNGVEYLPDSVNLSKEYLEKCQKLTEKIQSMIKNYCGHDYEYMDHSTASYFKCIKCGTLK